MRGNRFGHVLGISMALTLGACENETNSELAAPDAGEPPASTVSAAGTSIFHFKVSGPMASVSFFGDDAGGALIGDVQVSRNVSKTETSTFLFYSIQRCDSNTGECVLSNQGFGLIPNRDFVASRTDARLRTNTSASANPDFGREIGSGGAITLEWTQTSGFTTDFHGHSRTRFPGLSMEHSQFASTMSSALTEGTVFGIAVGPGNSTGTIGRARFGSLFILK
jgi:hypothetical protein